MSDISSIPEHAIANENGDFEFPQTPIHALPPCVPLTLSSDTSVPWDVYPEIRDVSSSILEREPVKLMAGTRVQIMAELEEILGKNHTVTPDHGVGLRFVMGDKKGVVYTSRRTPLDVTYRKEDQEAGLAISLANFTSILNDPNRRGITDFLGTQDAGITKVKVPDTQLAQEMREQLDGMREQLRNLLMVNARLAAIPLALDAVNNPNLFRDTVGFNVAALRQKARYAHRLYEDIATRAGISELKTPLQID